MSNPLAMPGLTVPGELAAPHQGDAPPMMLGNPFLSCTLQLQPTRFATRAMKRLIHQKDIRHDMAQRPVGKIHHTGRMNETPHLGT